MTPLANINQRADGPQPRTATPSAGTRIREVDGLRFFAIAAVLAIHYRPPQSPALAWMSLGWAGVDLFFVISGFLITGILLGLRKSQHPFKVFYWRRVLRIFPAYYAVLFVLIFLSIRENGGVIWDARYQNLAFLSSIQVGTVLSAFGTAFLHKASDCSPQLLQDHVFVEFISGIRIFWSLSVEELFYLCWAPIVLKCSRRTILLCAVLPIVLCPFARALAVHCDLAYYFGFLFRLDSLMAGSLLAILFQGRKRGVVSDRTLRMLLLSALPCLLLLLAFAAFHAGALRGIEIRTVKSFAIAGYTLIALVSACILGLSVLYSGSGRLWFRILRSKPLIHIGTISYTLYLIHIPVFVAVYRLSVKINHASKPSVPVTSVIALVVSIIISSLSWRYFESHFLAMKDKYGSTAVAPGIAEVQSVKCR